MINFLSSTRLSFAALSLLIPTLAMASPSTDLLDKLQKKYPNIPFTEVRETPVAGIYEAIFGKDMLYVESGGTYFFPTMVNMVTKQNFGDDRRAELNKVDFSELPLNDSISFANGDGSRLIAVFSDPNCIYCKKLEVELTKIKNATVHIFPVGILNADSIAKANAVSCSKGNKIKVWRAVLLEGAKIPENNCQNSPVERNTELFKRLGFQGTPSMILGNGIAIKGYVDAAKIEEALSKK